jgi:hypothetical protein
MRPLLSVSIVVFLIGSLVGFGTGQLASKQSPPPATGVARYIEGLRAWDGHAVWESYSPDYQSLLVEEGGGEAATVGLYAQLRKQGASIDQVDYIGGYQTKDAGHFLYVTRHFVEHQPPIEVVWVLQTDADGLIESID